MGDLAKTMCERSAPVWRSPTAFGLSSLGDTGTGACVRRAASLGEPPARCHEAPCPGVSPHFPLNASPRPPRCGRRWRWPASAAVAAGPLRSKAGRLGSERSGFDSKRAGSCSGRSESCSDRTEFRPERTGVCSKRTGFCSTRTGFCSERTESCSGRSEFRSGRTESCSARTGFCSGRTGCRSERNESRPERTESCPEGHPFPSKNSRKRVAPGTRRGAETHPVEGTCRR
jgi:hypothetical protein